MNKELLEALGAILSVYPNNLNYVYQVQKIASDALIDANLAIAQPVPPTK